MENNPWKTIRAITTELYIAKADKEAIEAVFKKSPEKAKKLQLEYLPQPYMGDPTRAKIFLLNGNPNAPDGKTAPKFQHRKFNEKYRETILNSLENKVKDYPLYALNPDFKEYSIYKWWYPRLKALIEECGIETVSRDLFVAEYFPYFSDRFRYTNGIYPESQKYIFNLIKEAMEAGKTIIIMRAKNKWYDFVKGLKKYRHVMELKNPRCTYISHGNMKRGDFDKILSLLHSPSNNL